MGERVAEQPISYPASPRASFGRPLVVFIAGAGRSGSTVLGDALGQMPGCFHAGELRFLLEQLDGGDRVCGCGRGFRDCEVWHAVVRQAFSQQDTPSFDSAELARFSMNELSYRPRSWWRLRQQSKLATPWGPSARHYAEALGQLYSTLATIVKAEVVIDSSKAAMHVYLGARFGRVRSHIVHLVRDPRAIAYSWQRRSVDGVSSVPSRVSVNWVLANLAVGALNDPTADVGYTLVRYEDFARQPRTIVKALSSKIGLSQSSSPFVDERTLHLEPNHTVAGNPSRFKSGDIELEPDDEWRRHMRRRDLMTVTLMTAVLLRRYSYPLLIDDSAMSLA